MRSKESTLTKTRPFFFMQSMESGLLIHLYDRILKEEAEFYRALSKLNTGDEQEAKRILRSIVEKQSFYAQRAL